MKVNNKQGNKETGKWVIKLKNSMVHSKIISEAKQSFGADLNTKSKARELRKNMTHAEKLLWDHIRKRQLNGVHFRRQHPYGIYILDFFCFEAQLVIEVDGMIHLNKLEYDTERTEYLELSGLTVIRFKNEDIENNIEEVLQKLNYYLSNMPQSLNSSKH